MITAAQAKELTAKTIQREAAELEVELERVINAAIGQSSTTTNYYPKNLMQANLALKILEVHEYNAELVKATDQRDRDWVKISW